MEEEGLWVEVDIETCCAALGPSHIGNISALYEQCGAGPCSASLLIAAKSCHFAADTPCSRAGMECGSWGTLEPGSQLAHPLPEVVTAILAAHPACKADGPPDDAADQAQDCQDPGVVVRTGGAVGLDELPSKGPRKLQLVLAVGKGACSVVLRPGTPVTLNLLPLAYHMTKLHGD